MSPRAAEAISWAILAGAVALSVSLRLAAPHWIAFVAAVAGLTVYSPWGKEWGPAGPATIALLSALAVLWGGWLGAAPERAAAAAFLATAATFARECAKDIEDLEGDRAVGRRTWAVRAGPLRVERATRCAAALAFLALPVPWLRGDADLRYLALAGALGAPIFAWVALRPGRYDRAVARRASGLLKLALFAGIAGLLLGARG
jgi:geranylgeranylglycerol-phosphate geranylgeranyltransferase